MAEFEDSVCKTELQELQEVTEARMREELAAELEEQNAQAGPPQQKEGTHWVGLGIHVAPVPWSLGAKEVIKTVKKHLGEALELEQEDIRIDAMRNFYTSRKQGYHTGEVTIRVKTDKRAEDYHGKHKMEVKELHMEYQSVVLLWDISLQERRAAEAAE